MYVLSLCSRHVLFTYSNDLRPPFKHPDEWLDRDDVEQSVHQERSHGCHGDHDHTPNQLGKDALTIVL